MTVHFNHTTHLMMASRNKVASARLRARGGAKGDAVPGQRVAI
jgi:hypothetical protein